jgi:hypothetical protein
MPTKLQWQQIIGQKILNSGNQTNQAHDIQLLIKNVAKNNIDKHSNG